MTEVRLLGGMIWVWLQMDNWYAVGVWGLVVLFG